MAASKKTAQKSTSKSSRKTSLNATQTTLKATKSAKTSSKSTKQQSSPSPKSTKSVAQSMDLDAELRSADQHKLKQRVVAILDSLADVYVDEFEGLDFESPLQLLVATILSAQSTDKLVNTVTPALFAKYHSATDYATVDQEELEGDIRSTGYYRSKAKHIRGCCAMLIEKHGGEVPGTMEELIALPGVGRKTANCVLSQCFGQQGLTVDTHVNRIANLLGLVHSTDAVKIEYELMDIVPKDRWNEFNELIITHGRKTCIARRPQCERCAIVDLCPSRQA